MTTADLLESMLDVPGISRALIAESPLSTIVYDTAGHPLFANAAFERLWGVQG